MPPGERVDVAVVGAGAAGLAAAAELRGRGLEPRVLDGDRRVGGTWARRYERLHLHTTRAFSGLPGMPLPRDLPRYVAKDDFAHYLEHYARARGLEVELGRAVERIEPSADGDGWDLRTSTGPLHARAVVVATGKHRVPRLPAWPGADGFGGRLLHSVDYRTGAEFAGRRALVVGLGNSGAEIAADLVDAGLERVLVAVRTAPPITAREIAGIPVQVLGILLAPLPSTWVDRMGALLRRVSPGDLSAHGLGREAWGPFGARRPPVIDVGFLDHLRGGRIEVRAALERFTADGVVFEDGTGARVDLVVAATGFTTGLEELLATPDVLDERGLPRTGANGESARPGLWFIGYDESPRGALHDARRLSRRLARDVARRLRAQ